MDKAMIEFKKIDKSYGDHAILKQFDLTIGEGTFLTMVGSSGCGKTTILKMINGLIQPDSGQIDVNGEDLAHTDLIALRRKIGYCIQGSVLFPHLTVADNVSYVLRLFKDPDEQKINQTVSQWLHTVGLNDDFLDRYPSELSGGQQQRVGIARALAASPKILLMDEPFGAVDSITRNQLQKEIKKIHEKTGITIVFVTHDISEALFLGTQVLVLDHGEIQQYDVPSEILHHPKTTFVRQLLDNSTSYLQKV